MKNFLALALMTVTLIATSIDADAARRFGGGNNIGKQRVTPTAPASSAAAPARFCGAWSRTTCSGSA